MLTSASNIKWVTRFLYFLLSLGILIVLYYGASFATPFKSVELPVTVIDRQIHFHIIFVYIYISFYLLFFISIMSNTEYYSWNCALCIVINTLIASCIFFFFPTHMPASIYSSEEHSSYFLSRMLHSLDVKNNCFPSLHVANAYAAAFYLAITRKFLLRFLIWLWFILICWSVISTGQHYFYDIPGGIILALISLYLTGKWKNKI